MQRIAFLSKACLKDLGLVANGAEKELNIFISTGKLIKLAYCSLLK